ncbi:hypothetical protein [Tenacibaculum sp. nBUS_03]|uniref:hypothetical protein n=1 Tax=Tenacibaculum sp. nBUS_03 TaxID=3395320 RepID=UPI003EB9D0D4
MVEVWSEKNSILKLSDTHVAYDNPEYNESEEGNLGGDEATKTFIFEALKPGTSFVMIKDSFQGKLVEKQKVKIEVIEKNSKNTK